MEPTTLIETARDALTNAHVPYSEYPVGAALETADGTVITGCNIEVANYSNTLHAEEVAIGTAVRNGHTEFRALAVASVAQDAATPCGMCRQTLVEFCPPAMPIYCDAADDIVTHTLGELLPSAFGEEVN